MSPAPSPADPAPEGSLDDATQRYESIKAQLKDGLAKKRHTDQDLTDLESQIYLYEGSYLSGTAASGGNVIRGFDSYMKAGTVVPGAVRPSSTSAVPTAEHRVFSTSSATYQRSLALKLNEAAMKDDAKAATAPQPSGYKLKRKVDDPARKKAAE
ncbi:chromatin modification- protein eaf6 [Malassezia sp. CBS 17886]|nr:chromatin modification- protein eaf6 [Malassezia sp. CBS 17886]